MFITLDVEYWLGWLIYELVYKYSGVFKYVEGVKYVASFVVPVVIVGVMLANDSKAIGCKYEAVWYKELVAEFSTICVFVFIVCWLKFVSGARAEDE